ncbi:nitroreductase family deazaflavin-dependent oxidoreductase [Gordonia sp. CPCC 205333]|uniref:nitroreductase family deazaflavin-dependent oxidoreductase n=1 Tax=Gordonia sp. CPCC 205333 TaxID=3140790 RepID=UPI003AF3585B
MNVLALHQKLYVASRGLLGHRLLGIPTLLLTATGRRSGQQRVSALVYGRNGGDYLVVASNGGAPTAPGWSHNLAAHPHASIQVGTRTVEVDASFVYPGEPTFAELWEIVNAANKQRFRGYEKSTTRPIPVVVLTPSRHARSAGNS